MDPVEVGLLVLQAFDLVGRVCQLVLELFFEVFFQRFPELDLFLIFLDNFVLRPGIRILIGQVLWFLLGGGRLPLFVLDGGAVLVVLAGPGSERVADLRGR